MYPPGIVMVIRLTLYFGAAIIIPLHCHTYWKVGRREAEVSGYVSFMASQQVESRKENRARVT